MLQRKKYNMLSFFARTNHGLCYKTSTRLQVLGGTGHFKGQKTLFMKQLTERQKQRRAGILAAARDLIAEHGYDGVTMRELAARSNVALKTLYQQYDNKENLLAKAVEDMHANVYADITATEQPTGFDKLMFIVDSVFTQNMDNDAYSRTVSGILNRGATTTTFVETRKKAYRQALEQIRADGDLVDQVNFDRVVDMMHRQSSILYTEWAQQLVETSQVAGTIKLQLCLLLSSLTTGETRARIDETIQRLMADPHTGAPQR